jgi:hypothetical protein
LNAITGVAQVIASIMARPNGSGQSIGANNAIAPLRNANFPSSVISPICSTFEPPSRGWTFASKILDIDLIHLRSDLERNGALPGDRNRTTDSILRSNAAKKRDVALLHRQRQQQLLGKPW